MPRVKRSTTSKDSSATETTPKRRQTKSDIEKLICKKKLDALEAEETLSKDDRFNFAEKEQLLEAFRIEGYKVFQDIELLHKYFPLRRRSDLKGLLSRLTSSLKVTVDPSNPLEEWSRACQQMLGPFAKDKKVSPETAVSDALLLEATVLEQETDPVEDGGDANYPEILRSFSQLMMGKFPDNLSSVNSLLLVNLFEHVNKVADTYMGNAEVSGLQDGSWVKDSTDQRIKRQEKAVIGLESFDLTTKKCPSFRDLDTNSELKTLCCELPKIKRLTDILNPLSLTETIFSHLMG